MMLTGPLGHLAAAEEPPFATYGANNGTVPPQYRWDIEMTIGQDGGAQIRYCRGYKVTSGSCAEDEFRLSEAELEDIRQALETSGLATTPAKELAEPPVGGSMSYGSVSFEGKVVRLPPHPEAADEARVESVISRIATAIPGDVIARLEQKAEVAE
jgi:hypothetical protein